MSETDSSAPKIIVDSDWKSQVAKEKQQAAEAAEAGNAASESNLDSLGLSDDPALDAGAMPAPGLEHIISVLFTQALMYLGQMPGGEDGEPLPVNKPMAKQVIDSLDVLSDKVKGNATDDEGKMLQGALHALRMAYVNTTQSTT
ncbi:MAG: DUF1844 domain-containing protein [Planctomycetota bacterium]